MDSLLSEINTLILKPELAPLLSLVKGARNGIVYGSKVRFPHALVMIFLFRSGTIREKTWLVLKATRQHARNLATFAVIYKASMVLLRNLPGGAGKEGRYDSFFAGLLGGYAVFGRQRGSISQQIVIYVFARVMLALAKLAVQPNMHPLSHLITSDARTSITNNAYPVFASMTWAMVMYIFRWHPETLASSLRSSMVYMYVLLLPDTIWILSPRFADAEVLSPVTNLHSNYSYGDSDHWDSLRTLLVHNK
ncbi:Mitochondrial inner membrane translocase subunit Tim17/Tim22/Tim23/peroxisomal protein PMP24 [Penicillium sp. DV-2018c]|nr:Mitochondrial inner membrane translocase subunit Tim17/Tim22/Tim23/peroxisomal protein PMP24 [Penicillium sp. DV-2018c]KAJ5566209.1 Mitochondrial inner membrane translocase subunit Tim17/Tim22/Tim23/peroxisomal protein PMP24 [Penicillium sp. DV-2018c]